MCPQTRAIQCLLVSCPLNYHTNFPIYHKQVENNWYVEALTVISTQTVIIHTHTGQTQQKLLLTKHGSGSCPLLDPSSAWSIMKQTGILPSQTSFLAAWSTILSYWYPLTYAAIFIHRRRGLNTPTCTHWRGREVALIPQINCWLQLQSRASKVNNDVILHEFFLLKCINLLIKLSTWTIRWWNVELAWSTDSFYWAFYCFETHQ